MTTRKVICLIALLVCGVIAHADEGERLRILQAALSDKDASVREQACMSLAALGSKALPASPTLVKAATTDPDPNVREEAIRALGYLINASDSAFDAVIHGLADSSGSVRLASIDALQEVDKAPQPAVGAVSAAMVHDIRSVFLNSAFDYLEKVDDWGPDALPGILSVLASADTNLETRAAKRASFLMGLTDEQSRQLSQALSNTLERGIADASDQGRLLTLASIKAARTPDHLQDRERDFLLSSSTNPDASIRMAAITSLAYFASDPACASGLRSAATNESDFRNRDLAVSSLRPKEDPDAAPVIKAALADPVARLRGSALEVISSATDDDLIRYVCDDLFRVTRDQVDSNRAKVPNLIVKCSPDEATRDLLTLAGDPVPLVRANAIEALGTLYGQASNRDLLFGLERGPETAGFWQKPLEIPKSVVDHLFLATTDPEQAVSQQALSALEKTVPLNNEFMAKAKEVVLTVFSRSKFFEVKNAIAAIRVFESFGTDADSAVPQLRSFLRDSVDGKIQWKYSRDTTDLDDDYIVTDQLAEAVSVMSLPSRPNDGMIEEFIAVNEKRTGGSAAALDAINRQRGKVAKPEELIKKLVFQAYSDDVDTARTRLLLRLSQSSGVVDALIAENEELAKTMKPPDESSLAGLLSDSDHPVYRLRRLRAYQKELSVARAGKVEVQDRSGKQNTITVDADHAIIAVGSWCPHSHLLSAFLSNANAKRIIPNVQLDFVFVNEWPKAEDEIKHAVDAGQFSRELGSQRLLSLKKASGDAYLIYPAYSHELPGESWIRPENLDAQNPTFFPAIYDPVTAKFSKSQRDFAKDDLLIPDWILRQVHW